MTRGKPPEKAIDQAAEIAGRRGDFIAIPGTRGDSFDIIIFEKFRTIFVKVKRSLTNFTWAAEVLHQYEREIARVHRVPLTTVTAREFWVRHPSGKWQYFLIRHDSVVEVRADGNYTPPAELPLIAPGPPVGGGTPEGSPDSTPSDK
jgi:hypothetical protein